MRITVVGTGGVGGYFGARLAQVGYDVGFLARGQHLKAMRQHGLQVESELGDIHLGRVRASDDITALGPSDIVLLCVKLWDTATALRAIVPIMKPETAIISLQNGVEKEAMIREACGERAVIGGVCYIGSKIVSPGVIQHMGKIQRLIFGEFDGRPSARTQFFLEACQHSGIDAEISRNITLAIWEKFVFLVGASATTTTMEVGIGAIRAHPATRLFLLDLMKEAVAVGRAYGVPLPENYAEDRLAFCDGVPAAMTSSMATDLEHGKPLEVQWLSGAVVKLGKARNIPTPLNRAVNDILALRAGGTHATKTIPPA